MKKRPFQPCILGLSLGQTKSHNQRRRLWREGLWTKHTEKFFLAEAESEAGAGGWDREQTGGEKCREISRTVHGAPGTWGKSWLRKESNVRHTDYNHAAAEKKVRERNWQAPKTHKWLEKMSLSLKDRELPWFCFPSRGVWWRGRLCWAMGFPEFLWRVLLHFLMACRCRNCRPGWHFICPAGMLCT